MLTQETLIKFSVEEKQKTQCREEIREEEGGAHPSARDGQWRGRGNGDKNYPQFIYF